MRMIKQLKMKRMKGLIFGSILMIFVPVRPGLAQEAISNLKSNPQIRSAWQEQQKPRLKIGKVDTIHLPFTEDFSRSAIYPDERYWADKEAFINTGFPVNPVTIGVATLDAIDQTGSLYANAGFRSFLADRLTSNVVDLDYPMGSGIYFSFFYQPGGLGDAPEPADSLVLEFYSDQDSSWHSVWRASYFKEDTLVLEITPSDTFTWKPDTFPSLLFQQVLIPVNDEKYLNDHFFFRFKNYASLIEDPDPGEIGNADMWHIDYIRLDKNRNANDVVINDLAFTKPLSSMLNSYNAMPWIHFASSANAFSKEYNGRTSLWLQNNDTRNKGFERTKTFRDMITGQKVSQYAGGDSIRSQSELELKDVLPSSFSDLFSESTEDTAQYELRVILTTDIDDYKDNDTIVRIQKFHNYYAYDDGTAEVGYGISGQGAINSKVAVQFRTYKIDTLKAVDIFFNKAYNEANKDNFILTVWEGDEDNPGDTLYSRANLDYIPEFGNSLNEFQRYYLDTAVIVRDIFYIGWLQTTNDFLNVGFDLNTPNNTKNFYNISGTWINSKFKGSIMFRPVFGPLFDSPVSVKSIRSAPVLVYPNPADDMLYIKSDILFSREPLCFKIFNIQGMLVEEGISYNGSIPVSHLPTGMYLLKLDPDHSPVTKKIIISR